MAARRTLFSMPALVGLIANSCDMLRFMLTAARFKAGFHAHAQDDPSVRFSRRPRNASFHHTARAGQQRIRKSAVLRAREGGNSQ